MDRQGSLEHALRRAYLTVILGPCACILLLAVPPGHARQDSPTVADAPSGRAPQDSPAVPDASPAEPIERRPYRISLHMAFDPSARIDELKRAELIREWQVLVRRFIGAPWVVSIADPSSPLANFELDSLEPDAFASAGSFDKVWVVRVARSRPRLGARIHRSRVRHGDTAAWAAAGADRVRHCRMPLARCSSSHAIFSTRPR